MRISIASQRSLVMQSLLSFASVMILESTGKSVFLGLHAKYATRVSVIYRAVFLSMLVANNAALISCMWLSIDDRPVSPPDI